MGRTGWGQGTYCPGAPTQEEPFWEAPARALRSCLVPRLGVTGGVGPPLLLISGGSGEGGRRETERGQARIVSQTREVGSVCGGGHCSGAQEPCHSSCGILGKPSIHLGSLFSQLPSGDYPTPSTSEGQAKGKNG